MFQPKTLLFYAFIVIFINVSLSGSEVAGRSVCLLQDPPHQCGDFCLTTLMPLIGYIAKNQNQWSTCNLKLNETEAKLSKIEDQLKVVKNQSEEQLQALQVKIESQQSAMMDALSQLNRKIMLLRFNRIGSRFFYIEHNLQQNWTSAINTCKLLGGHLASIKSEEEFNAISAQLKRDISYTLGINDLAEKGVFISVSSGNRAPFLKWKPGEPKYDHISQRCVTVNNGGMWVDSCSGKHNFICEAED
nr:accessory gland protein Acp29AB [Drosophila takahashii]